jgi:hypothetical protein
MSFTWEPTEETIQEAREILVDRYDEEPSHEDLMRLAAALQQEQDDEADAMEAERLAQEQADLEYVEKCEALAELRAGVHTVAESSGWEIELRSCSHKSSSYYNLRKAGEVVTLRISDHEARNGAGFNRETGMPHDECDINLVAVRDTLYDLAVALSDLS